MARLSFLLTFIACVAMSVGIVSAQDNGVNGGTVEGKIPENMSQNPKEHWYNLTLMNTKIGYMHISSEKTEYEGEKVDRNKINMVMNLKALGSNITIEITRVEYTGGRFNAALFPLDLQ